MSENFQDQVTLGQKVGNSGNGLMSSGHIWDIEMVEDVVLARWMEDGVH